MGVLVSLEPSPGDLPRLADAGRERAVTEYYAIDFARVSSTILLKVTNGAIVGVICSLRHNPHVLIGRQLEALPRRYKSRLRAITRAEFK